MSATKPLIYAIEFDVIGATGQYFNAGCGEFKGRAQECTISHHAVRRYARCDERFSTIYQPFEGYPESGVAITISALHGPKGREQVAE